MSKRIKRDEEGEIIFPKGNDKLSLLERIRILAQPDVALILKMMVDEVDKLAEKIAKLEENIK